jgi:hypothetical protein
MRAETPNATMYLCSACGTLKQVIGDTVLALHQTPDKRAFLRKLYPYEAHCVQGDHAALEVPSKHKMF